MSATLSLMVLKKSLTLPYASKAHKAQRTYTVVAEQTSEGTISEILWGKADTPFGNCLIAWTKIADLDCICFLAFVNEDNINRAKNDLQKLWFSNPTVEDKQKAKLLAEQVFSSGDAWQNLGVLVKGTNFQIQAWKALYELPHDATLSYQQFAQYVGGARYARAAASAIAKNNIAYLIPCHLIINKSGKLGGYRWGVAIKKMILR